MCDRNYPYYLWRDFWPFEHRMVKKGVFPKFNRYSKGVGRKVKLRLRIICCQLHVIEEPITHIYIADMRHLLLSSGQQSNQDFTIIKKRG